MGRKYNPIKNNFASTKQRINIGSESNHEKLSWGQIFANSKKIAKVCTNKVNQTIAIHTTTTYITRTYIKWVSVITSPMTTFPKFTPAAPMLTNTPFLSETYESIVTGKPKNPILGISNCIQ